MKNELLVISDNFNEVSKYRSYLESAFNVNLRSSLDEVKLFLEKNNDEIDLVIIDMDSNNKDIETYIELIEKYDISYSIIMDLNDISSLDIDIEFYKNNIGVISRQSIYHNLRGMINDKLSINTEEFNYE